MKTFSTDYTFSYDWSQVTLAHWQKYPNPISTHVVHVDVLRRDVDPATGVLMTERLITCQQNVPSLIRKLFGGDDLTYALEISQTDPKGRSMVLRSVNLTWSEYLRVEETCTYVSDPISSMTQFYQEARIEAEGVMSRLKGYVEEMSVKKFGENAGKGKVGFEWVLERLRGQGEELANKVRI